uniref:UBA domain-containing protein n=1 Tax=Globodera pallida TaxID=36090 RepID=A0A183BYN2_GLOPA
MQSHAVVSTFSVVHPCREWIMVHLQPGLGHCTKTNATLHLKSQAKPVFCKARPVPHGVLDVVDKELDRLLQIGAIKAQQTAFDKAKEVLQSDLLCSLSMIQQNRSLLQLMQVNRESGPQ